MIKIHSFILPRLFCDGDASAAAAAAASAAAAAAVTVSASTTVYESASKRERGDGGFQYTSGFVDEDSSAISEAKKSKVEHFPTD